MRAIGREDLITDPHFATNAARIQRVDAINDVVQAWFLQHDLDEAMAILDAADVPAGPVNTMAEVVADPRQIYESHLVIKVQKPDAAEAALLRPGSTLIALLQPMSNHDLVRDFAERDITSFSMDAIPRTTCAQSMDVLSSQATVAGYKAVLMAADNLPKFFPMLTTAAGSIVPAKVLVVGAGLFTSLSEGRIDSLAPGALVTILLGMLIGAALMLPVLMAVWFAPALVVFHGRDAVQALKESFIGCLKNILPFFVYGLVMFVFGILASIPFGLGWLVLGPVLAASVYTSYKDIFIAS